MDQTFPYLPFKETWQNILSKVEVQHTLLPLTNEAIFLVLLCKYFHAIRVQSGILAEFFSC